VGAKRVGRGRRSKVERIINKMTRSGNSECRENKKGAWRSGAWDEWEDTVALQKYTPVSSRARGTTK
jgi:hypothetical protein